MDGILCDKIYITINLELNAVHCPKYYSFTVTVTMVQSMPTQYLNVEPRKGYRKGNIGPGWCNSKTQTYKKLLAAVQYNKDIKSSYQQTRVVDSAFTFIYTQNNIKV